jgi:hypothetical protein
MEKEPRKASEVILELESKIDVLMGLVRSQDLNMKILSNKLNALMEKLDKSPTSPKIMVEAVNTTPNAFNTAVNVDAGKTIPVNADFNLPVEDSPLGFRRTSRPETYAGDNSYLPVQPKAAEPRFPTQIPRPSGQAEIVVPTNINRQQGQPLPTQPPKTQPKSEPVEFHEGNSIPVSQRVVDGNGKSVFLADVEVTDLTTMQLVFKTRTNGTGKWSAPLSAGAYRVIIRKRESLTKEKLEVAQEIQVDGTVSPLELSMMIIKK